MDTKIKSNKYFTNVYSFFFENKYVILFSLIIGFIAYGFAFANKLLNWDDLCNLFSKGATLIGGRWGLELTQYLFLNFSTPWLNGIISLIFLTLSVCFIIKIFNISKLPFKLLIAGLFIVFPSQIGTFAYMFTCVPYSLALFLSVLSVYFGTKPKFKNALFSVISLILSLSIYQAYVAVAASLFVIFVILELFDNNKTIQESLIKGIYLVIILLISMATYYGITQIVLLVTDTSFSNYTESMLNNNSSIISKIISVYKDYISIFLWRRQGIVSTKFSRICNLIVLFVLGYLAAINTIKTKHILKIALIIICCLVFLPIAINCIKLITPENHLLTKYSFVAIYVFTIILLDKNNTFVFSEFIKKISVVVLSIIVISNCYIANISYLKMHLEYENEYYLFSSIMNSVKAYPGFDEDSKIAIVGNFDDPEYFSEFESLRLFYITGIGGAKNSNGRNNYIKYYLGMDVNFASDEEIMKISQTDEFKNMKEYPYYGHICEIDNIIVVKISDVNHQSEVE